ncbi:MAG: hypothetical protein V1644_02020, partial [Candidatus Micrarchaeota archaeon]
RELKKPQHQTALLDLIAQIANLGYYPHEDAIGIVRTNHGLKLVIHDLDTFAHQETLTDAQKDKEMRKKLVWWANEFVKHHSMTSEDAKAQIRQRLTNKNLI